MGGDVDIAEGMHVQQVVAAGIEKNGLLTALKQYPIVSKCNQSHADIFRFIFINLFFSLTF
jgi:hypothetical protein